MKLEELINRVVQNGVEMWEVGVPGPLYYEGIMIDDEDVAKELKRLSSSDKKAMQLVYERLNAPLFVIERYYGKPKYPNSGIVIDINGKDISFGCLLTAKAYSLSKNKTVTFKKVNEFDGYAYGAFQDMINRGGFCGHENKEACPVSYLKKWEA